MFPIEVPALGTSPVLAEVAVYESQTRLSGSQLPTRNLLLVVRAKPNWAADFPVQDLGIKIAEGLHDTFRGATILIQAAHNPLQFFEVEFPTRLGDPLPHYRPSTVTAGAKCREMGITFTS